MVNTSVVPSVVLALRTSFNSSPSFFMNSSTCGERGEGVREGGREGGNEGGRGKQSVILTPPFFQTHTHTHSTWYV